jgi:hypothetical protein
MYPARLNHAPMPFVQQNWPIEEMLSEIARHAFTAASAP